MASFWNNVTWLYEWQVFRIKGRGYNNGKFSEKCEVSIIMARI